MAHLFLLTRGPEFLKTTWMAHMQGQYWQYYRDMIQKDKDGKDVVVKDVEHKVQGMLRPIELWEYILPEECIPQCLTSMGALDFKIVPDKDGKNVIVANRDKKGVVKINDDFNNRSPQKYLLPFLRKALGAQKLPPKMLEPTNKMRLMSVPTFGANIIGWKPDNVQSWESEKIAKQEML